MAETGYQTPDSTVNADEAQPQAQQDTQDYVLGEFTSFDYSDQPFVELTTDEQNIIHELVVIASRTDMAARRFEVEQAWEARLFNRGYQHLLPRRGGGWELPGQDTKWGPLATADSAALYSTNMYGRDHDTIVAAIAREVPKVQFFPRDINNPVDLGSAEAANDFKYIFEKNANLRERLMDLADIYYTDGRAVLYTRYVVNAQKYGYDDEGQPRGCEEVDVLGKLEAKLPVQCQSQDDMHFIQAYAERDVSQMRAKYPWIKDRIRPGSCGIGEVELDRIARINTRLALLGSYVTGDAMVRDVTEQYTWFRPSIFYDETVPRELRDGFLEKFPKGMLVVYAGQIFAFARNESMDDHLKVSHCFPGIGQNRRAIGSSGISVQKRSNAWFDIMDDFFRRTVARRWYHADAFDIELIQSQDNTPGGSGPYLPQPGATAEDLCFIEPTPTPQPALPEFVQWFFGDVSTQMTGAVGSLFASPDEDSAAPVGTTEIRRDQALSRIGTPWNSAKTAFAASFRQAVGCAASCRPEGSEVSEVVPGKGNISVSVNDLKGNVVCYPEYDSAFPESWSDREARYTELVIGAAQNPFYAKMLESPKNLRAIADNIRMADLEVPGEASSEKQLDEIEQMIENQGPVPNPAIAQAELAAAQMPPDQALMAQQQVSQLPPLVSSVPVAQDDSENHAIEAQTCFEWMNGRDGRKFKNGTAEQQATFQDVSLHRQAHMQMAEKLKPQAPVAPPPHVSIPFKELPPPGKAQAAAKAGLMIPPEQFQQEDLTKTQHKIAERVVPKTVPENLNVNRVRRRSNVQGGQ